MYNNLPEPEIDFVLGRLHSIAAVNDVAPNLHRQNRYMDKHLGLVVGLAHGWG
jgi:hypothetical protein